MQAVIYRKLNELVERFKGESQPNQNTWVRSLFEALDWGGSDRSTFSIAPDESGFQLQVDKFPVINIVVDSSANATTIHKALNRAYNQDVAWVVATNFRETALYGSYWISRDYDVDSALALEINFNDYLSEVHNLELLTPEQVAHNKLTQLYSAFPRRKQRQPIDIHLIERMSVWRTLALDAIGNVATKSDALVHRFINSLFLMRYIEDTKAFTNLFSLRDIAKETSSENFSIALRSSLTQIQRQTGYNVPSEDELTQLKQAPLRQLIEQLYGYPEWGVEYDFAAMNVDVLGRFYEEYLRLDVTPPQERRQSLTLFDPPTYEFEDVRKERGIFYTPRFIVDYILDKLIDRYKGSSDSDRLPYIIDTAAGSGTFLVAAVDRLIAAFPDAIQRHKDLGSALIAVDVDPRAIEAARLNLTAKFIAHKMSDGIPFLKFANVDVLAGGVRNTELSAYLPSSGVDIVVGNPPFINYERLKKQYDMSSLRANYETSDQRFDSYILFVEIALKLLHKGGLGGLVLPNSLLRTSTAANLREYLAGKADILEIVDFLDQPVFQNVGAYVCLLLFRKRSSQHSPIKATVAKVHHLSVTPAAQLARISVATKEVQDGIEVFRHDQPQGTAPWTFHSETEDAILNILQSEAHDTLGTITQIRQGIKTGADDVFIFDVVPFEKNTYRVAGTKFFVDRELLLPVLRNRDLRRWATRSSSFLLYPYDKNANHVLSWETLISQYPATAEYLQAHEAQLKQRSLRSKQWYELIEARTQTVHSDKPHLFTSELSLRPVVCQSSVKDTVVVGNSWLTITNMDYDERVLMAYLNSIVAEYYFRQVSHILRGGYMLLRKNNLTGLPLPKFLKARDSFFYDEIRRLSDQLVQKLDQNTRLISPQVQREVTYIESQIDSLVIAASGVNASQAGYIRDKTGVDKIRN